MKNYFIIIFLLFIVYFSQAQIVNIPDTNFKNALINEYVVDTNGDGIGDTNADLNNDGEIQLTEAQAVIGLVLFNSNIASLEGIQSFSNLEYLECSLNNLTSLNITQNSNLLTLKCNDNELTSLDISQSGNLEWLMCGQNQLESIDVSQNPDLKVLYLKQNNLTFLDVTQNLNLEILNISVNEITSLDITQNAQLIKLLCNDNDLTSLDVSQNPNLEDLVIYSNSFSQIDISHNSTLRLFYVGSNQLTSIDLTQNPSLELVSFWDNQLMEIDFSLNPEITTLDISSNLLYNLDLTENPNLWSLDCNYNQLVSLNIKNGANTSLEYLSAYDNPNLNCIQVDDPIYANNQTDWVKDATAVYSEDCILGTQYFSKTTFILYPSPVQNTLNINTAFPIDSMKIYTLQGQLLIETKNNQIDVSQLNSGLYFASIIINGENNIKKFIKS